MIQRGIIFIVIVSLIALNSIFDVYAADAVPSVLADHILIEKAAHKMTLYAGDHILKTYTVALGRGGLEAKGWRGDNKTPEGNYKIDSRNPHSLFHLSLHISYPNQEDIARATTQGKDPGGDIMIHGIRNGLGWIGTLQRKFDWTAGCIAVTDPEIEEIWSLIPDGTAVEIRP